LQIPGADAAQMMRPKKIEVNIWSDQLTPKFESSILAWSDQIRVDNTTSGLAATDGDNA